MDNEDPDNSTAEDRLGDMPIRSEEIGFAPDELTRCAGCGKPNAPNRSACLYCGAELTGSAKGNKLDLRPLEIWENGFNVVAMSAAVDDLERVARAISPITSTEAATIVSMLSSGRSLPIARVESEYLAAVLSEKLADLGVETRTISDAALQPNTRPVRLRKIELSGDDLLLTLFNNSAEARLAVSDLALMVVGTLIEGRVESVQKRKRGTNQTVSEIQTSSDLPVIDLYSRDDPGGWRISAHGFDFSILGNGKSMLAGENMRRLIATLSERSPDARVVDDFDEMSPLLENWWPGESRRDAFGFKRSGFGRKDLTSVSISNNSIQLLKYSRLQWHLL